MESKKSHAEALTAAIAPGKAEGPEQGHRSKFLSQHPGKSHLLPPETDFIQARREKHQEAVHFAHSELEWRANSWQQ